MRDTSQLVLLNERARRVAMCYRFHSEIFVDIDTGVVKHVKDVRDGAEMLLFGKREGYPPHLG